MPTEVRPVFGDDNDHGKYASGHDTELDETVD